MTRQLRMGTAIMRFFFGRNFFWACLCWGAVCGLFGMSVARAEDSAKVNTLGTSMSLSGLTGLVLTQSAHTLPPWKVAVSGAGIILHDSTNNLYEGEALVGLGLPGRIELAAMLPGAHYDTNVGNITGLSDLQLSAKWRVLDQKELQWPAIALSVTGTIPTGKQGNPTLPFSQPGMGLRTVDDYGLAFRLIGSAEVDFTPDPYAVGLYAAGGFSFQDLNQSSQDKYGTYALGAALPLIMNPDSPLSSPLQLLLELDGTYKRGNKQDYLTLMPSLRYVGAVFTLPVSVTAGVQYIIFTEASSSNDAVGGVLQAELRFR
jgi:hypothetical protein